MFFVDVDVSSIYKLKSFDSSQQFFQAQDCLKIQIFPKNDFKFMIRLLSNDFFWM